MTILYHDFETRSELDLKAVELDRYVKHPSTQVLMLSWAIDNGKIDIWFPAEEKIPVTLLAAMSNPKVKKCAWEVSFERNVWKHVLGIDTEIEEWVDPAVLARSLSMPGSLGKVGDIMGLPEDLKKMKIGRSLIKFFCMPYKVKKGKKQEHEKYFGEDAPEYAFHSKTDNPKNWAEPKSAWDTFVDYCMGDTGSERQILTLLSSLPLSEIDQLGWYLDQKINERGIPTNRKFAQNALAMGLRYQKEQMEKMKALTGLENPNSTQQLIPWVKERGYPYNSLLKKLVDNVLKNFPRGETSTEKSIITPRITEEACEALKLRLESGKNSFKKFDAMLDQLSEDDRLRRQFLFLGAARSGRWSGRGVQVHNLTRPSIKDIERAMVLIEQNDYDTLKKEFPSVIEAISSCVRSALQASPGYTFVVSDLNAIENRVLGWVCNEPAIQHVFDMNLDPYLDFASRLFKIPYAELEKNFKGYKKALKEKRTPTEAEQDAADKRQLAKPVVLGAGYGLGGGKEVLDKKTGETKKTGLWGYGAGMGVSMTQEESNSAVKIFREAYANVPIFWKKIERACMDAIMLNRKTQVGFVTVSCATRKNGQKILRIQLPSNRYLTYMNARIETRVITSQHLDEDGEEIEDSYEKETIAYDGIGHGVAAVEGVRGWGKVYTYGGKLTENIVQAISRDILLYAMLLADKVMDIVLHVHDEIGAEVLKEKAKEMLEKLVDFMSTTPPWAPGLKLGAEGYISDFYKKG